MGNDNPILALTPEQIDTAFRLEKIFMPQARRQREEAYKRREATAPNSDDLRLVHYTSAEAALSIIRTKRMWMRNSNCMADYREVQHGLDILDRFFLDAKNTRGFTAALDTCVPGATQEAFTQFNVWRNDIRFNTFITSVSEHDDSEDRTGRLSMWRGFGTSAVRVAIIFKVPRVSFGAMALRFLFSPVAYLTEPQAHAVMAEVVTNIGDSCEFLKTIEDHQLINTVFMMFLAGVTCLKHPGFHEEREWRAIYCPTLFPSPFMESETKAVGGVPQLIHKIPLDKTISTSIADLDFAQIFDRLIIGPSPYPWPMYGAFRDELTKAGVVDAKDRIWSSEIPIRSS